MDTITDNQKCKTSSLYKIEDLKEVPVNAADLINYVEEDIVQGNKHKLKKGIDFHSNGYIDLTSDPDKTFKTIQHNILKVLKS